MILCTVLPKKRDGVTCPLWSDPLVAQQPHITVCLNPAPLSGALQRCAGRPVAAVVVHGPRHEHREPHVARHELCKPREARHELHEPRLPRCRNNNK